MLYPWHLSKVYDGYFSDFIEDIMKVFMDASYVCGSSFDLYLANLSKVLKQCEELNLLLT